LIASQKRGKAAFRGGFFMQKNHDRGKHMQNSNRPSCRQDCNVWFFAPEKCKECPHNNLLSGTGIDNFFRMMGVELSKKKK
jgi:hypothetical protein